MSSTAVDVAVIGGGIIGAAVAQRAAAEGLRVALVSSLAIGDGVTAAGMGHLVVLDDDAAEFALCRYSLALWEVWSGRMEAEFQRCGTLWLARDDAELDLLAAKAQRLRAHAVPCEDIAAADLVRVEPMLAPGLAGGLRVSSDAVVYAPRVAAAMASEVLTAGGQVLTGREVRQVRDGAVELADGERIDAAAIVVAAGGETPQLLPEIPLTPKKGHLIISDRYPGTLSHQLVEVGYGASTHAAAASVACNVQPRATGQWLVGSSREPGKADHAVDGAMLARMLARAAEFLPGLRRLRMLRAWAGVRPATVDGRPYIGPLTRAKNILVAAGHEGLGVTTALGTAAIVVDQILGRATAIDAIPFAPARVGA